MRAKRTNIYPELAKYMACKKMNLSDLGKVMGIKAQAVSKKLRGETEFNRPQMVMVRDYFKDINPDLTIDELFKIFLHT